MTCLQMNTGMENLKCDDKENLLSIEEPCIRSPFRERATFYNAKKLQNETVTEYYSKLLDLSITCEFNEYFADRVLCDKFITGFRQGLIFEHLCSEKTDITLGDALNVALKYENVLRQSSMERISKLDNKTSSTNNKLNVLVEELEIKSDPLEFLEVPVPNTPQSADMIDTSFICYLCKSPFENTEDCRYHIAKHLHYYQHTGDVSYPSRRKNKSKKYFCEICGKTCDRRHFIIHSNDKKFKCKTCGKLFNSSTNCRAHAQTHSADNPFKCETCNREFKQKRHLKRHLDVHFGVKRFKCNICSQMFRLKATLNNHVRLHETSKLNCHHCKLTFRDRSKYDDHIQKYANVKKQCDICGKQVKYMKAHMEHHNSPRSHECRFCEKTFIRRQELVAHEKLHTGLDCFSCHICDKKFNRENSLKAHLIRHTSKNFICSTCGKTFFRNDELGRHILTHSDAKNFKCDFCDTLFTCQRSKLRHTKNKHH